MLDAFALLAFLKDEPAQDVVGTLLGRRDCAVTSVNLAEVADNLIRVERLAADAVHARVRDLVDAGVRVVAVDVHLATRAADLRAEHYHRTRSPLSLADCICLAAAGPDDAIATADKPLLRAARAEGVEVVALPR